MGREEEYAGMDDLPCSLSALMLIIRDMAKTILAENLPDTQELLTLQEGHPQKERVEKYAASFQKLADTFYGMPYRRDYLSSRQVERIMEDTNAKVCYRCYQREICWGEHKQGTMQRRGRRWCGLWRAETRMIFGASGLTGQAYVPVLYSIMKLLRRTSRERSRT